MGGRSTLTHPARAADQAYLTQLDQHEPQGDAGAPCHSSGLLWSRATDTLAKRSVPPRHDPGVRSNTRELANLRVTFALRPALTTPPSGATSAHDVAWSLVPETQTRESNHPGSGGAQAMGAPEIESHVAVGQGPVQGHSQPHTRRSAVAKPRHVGPCLGPHPCR